MTKGELLNKIEKEKGRLLPDGGVETLTELVWKQMYSMDYSDELLSALIDVVYKRHLFDQEVEKPDYSGFGSILLDM